MYAQKKKTLIGVSPLIASVLLIAVTVSIATLTTGWVSSTTREAQHGVENKTLSEIQCASASITIENVYVAQGSNGTATVVVRNSGQTSDLQITSAELYDSHGNNFTAINSPVTDFDEGSSSILEFQFPVLANTTTDSSNYGNNGTLGTDGNAYGHTNDPTWTLNGKVSGAMEFDGADDYVNAGNDTSLFGMSQLTISAWIKRKQAASGGQDHIVTSWTGSYHFILNGNQLEFDLFNSTNGQSDSFKGGPIISNDIWYHLAATYDGSLMRIFVDGIEFTGVAFSGDVRGFYGEINTTIGASPSPGWSIYRFNGTIDDVAIWNRSLTGSEINTSMNNGPSSVTNTNDMVGYWEFNDASGVINCPADFSRVLVSTNCGGIFAEFSTAPKC